MATVVIMVGRAGANGSASAAPVWVGFPRAATSATSSGTSAQVGTLTANKGETVSVYASAAVWLSDDGTAAAADAGLYVPAGETFIAQYPAGNLSGWRVIDA